MVTDMGTYYVIDKKEYMEMVEYTHKLEKDLGDALISKQYISKELLMDYLTIEINSVIDRNVKKIVKNAVECTVQDMSEGYH